jgi:hypothetical protein
MILSTPRVRMPACTRVYGPLTNDARARMHAHRVASRSSSCEPVLMAPGVLLVTELHSAPLSSCCVRTAHRTGMPHHSILLLVYMHAGLHPTHSSALPAVYSS